MRTFGIRFGSDWTPSPPEVLDQSLDDQLADVVGLLSGRRWCCLTGAGVSTDSGIPDYRGPDSPRATPMMYDEFVGSYASRQRYWARSFLGWRRMGRAQPNDGHRALAELSAAGMSGVITQNVDGLHRSAGSDPVIELHGRISDCICLDCGRASGRADYQDRLADLNPGLASEDDLGHTELRPDGDAVVDSWEHFRVAPCEHCAGVLKPDVVFFGETVPKDRVLQCYRMVDSAEAMLVAGSSLSVMSGLRFVRHAAKKGKPVIIVNRGATRGDDLASCKVDASTSEVLAGLLNVPR